MRISDWSSDVCSSDLQYVSRVNPNQEIATRAGRQVRDSIKATLGWEKALFGDYKTSVAAFYNGRSGLPYTWTINGDTNGDGIFQDPEYIRSEEHTSELQSLMRISYAVFCLKKKKTREK